MQVKFHGCCCDACIAAPRLLRPLKTSGFYGHWSEGAAAVGPGFGHASDSETDAGKLADGRQHRACWQTSSVTSFSALSLFLPCFCVDGVEELSVRGSLGGVMRKSQVASLNAAALGPSKTVGDVMSTGRGAGRAARRQKRKESQRERERSKRQEKVSPY